MNELAKLRAFMYEPQLRSYLHVDGHVHVVTVWTRTGLIEAHLPLTSTGKPAVLLLSAVTAAISIAVRVVFVLLCRVLVVSFQKGPASKRTLRESKGGRIGRAEETGAGGVRRSVAVRMTIRLGFAAVAVRRTSVVGCRSERVPARRTDVEPVEIGQTALTIRADALTEGGRDGGATELRPSTLGRLADIEQTTVLWTTRVPAVGLDRVRTVGRLS